MLALSVSQIREIESQAKRDGISERTLIENASSNLFKVIDGLNLGRKVLVIAGRGNNGADVLSCAVKLLSAEYDAKVVILAEKPLGEEALFQKKIIEKKNIEVCTVKDKMEEIIKREIEGRDFILEGILGIGVKGELNSFLKKSIRLINESGKKVVSCDVPSGLDPDEGVVLGEAVRANYTVTFIENKKGFFINQGPDCCGKIYVVDIGIN